MLGASCDDDASDKPLAARRSRWDVRETRIRQPRKVIRELKRVAEAKGITMNALIAGYIDAGLKHDGRRGVHEIAPWFDDYLRPKGGSCSIDDRTGHNDEDFT